MFFVYFFFFHNSVLTIIVNWKVYKFYEYWVNFESWRDFTGVGAEHKPEDAGSREEKRWMMKENERLAKKLKKKEMERLIALGKPLASLLNRNLCLCPFVARSRS